MKWRWNMSNGALLMKLLITWANFWPGTFGDIQYEWKIILSPPHILNARLFLLRRQWFNLWSECYLPQAASLKLAYLTVTFQIYSFQIIRQFSLSTGWSVENESPALIGSSFNNRLRCGPYCHSPSRLIDAKSEFEFAFMNIYCIW